MEKQIDYRLPWVYSLSFGLRLRLLCLLAVLKQPVFVYQLGRVGSTTVTISLQNRGVLAFHIHSLIPERIEDLLRWHAIRWRHNPARRVRDITDARRALYLRKWIDGQSNTKFKVITLVREPVAREVSLFFFLGMRISEFVDRYNRNPITVREVVDAFLDRPSETEHHLFTWFSSEMKPVFGIDVFDEGFPKSRGYKIYEGERAQLLLLKLEKLNDCAQDAFEEFLGVKDISLVNANVGDDGEYGSLYRAFKEECVLPQAYLDRMYRSTYMQHFYSEEEIDQFIARWGKGCETGRIA